MPEDKTLVDKFYGIVDGYYSKSDDFNEVEKALKLHDRIFEAVRTDSLASDGWMMIESVLNDRREVSGG